MMLRPTDNRTATAVRVIVIAVIPMDQAFGHAAGGPHPATVSGAQVIVGDIARADIVPGQ